MAFKPSKKYRNNQPVENKPQEHKSQLAEIEVKDLPSKFKSYKNKKISFRPYTFGDVNRLNQSKLSQTSKIKRILEGITCGFDPYLLTFADFLYINLLRKISTFGSKKFKVKFSCSLCKSTNTLNVDEGELEFDDIEVDMPITATLSNNRELVFSPLTVKDYLTLLNKNLADDRIAVLAIQVANIQYDEAFEIIDKAVGDDSDILEEVDSLLYHTLKPMNIKCESCGQIIKVNLDGGQTIVYPFRERFFSPRDALRFGVQKHS